MTEPLTANWLKSQEFQEILEPPRFSLKVYETKHGMSFCNWDYLVTVRYSGIMDRWNWMIEQRSASFHTWEKMDLPSDYQPQDTEGAVALVKMLKCENSYKLFDTVKFGNKS